MDREMGPLNKLFQWSIANSDTDKIASDAAATASASTTSAKAGPAAVRDTTASTTDGAEASSAVAPREPIDPKWIDVVLGKTDAIRMKECMDFLEKDDATLKADAMASRKDGDTTEIDLDDLDDGREAAWEDLDSLVSSIDNANDLVPTKLWPRLLRFVRGEDMAAFSRIEESMRSGALTVAATAVANNPKAVTALQHQISLHEWLALIVQEPRPALWAKYVKILSGILSLDGKARQAFVTTEDGIAAMQTLLQKASDAGHLSTLWKTCHFLDRFFVACTTDSDTTTVFTEADLQARLRPLVPSLYSVLSKYGKDDMMVSEKALVLLFRIEGAASATIKQALQTAKAQFNGDEDSGLGMNTPLEDLLK